MYHLANLSRRLGATCQTRCVFQLSVFALLIGSMLISGCDQQTVEPKSTSTKLEQEVVSATGIPPALATTNRNDEVVPKQTESKDWDLSAPTSTWDYSEDKDEVRGTKSTVSCMRGINMVEQQAPYENTYPKFCIRIGGLGNDTWVSIGEGQIVCRSYNNCRVPVKIGGASMRLFDGAEPTDYSSDILFLTPAAPLRTAAQNGQTIIIELPIYQAGTQQLTFNLAGYSPPK